MVTGLGARSRRAPALPRAPALTGRRSESGRQDPSLPWQTPPVTQPSSAELETVDAGSAQAAAPDRAGVARAGPAPATLAAPARADRTGRPLTDYAGLLGALSLMWGSSYLFIKIGVETLPPLSLVLLRVMVGLAILLVVVALRRTPLPRDRRTLGHLAVLGAINIAIPFWLVGWAEQRIDSGLTGILQSTSPFFTLVTAATFVHDERVTRGRLAGIAIGFMGIVLLSVENVADLTNPLGAERLLGELAVVVGSLCYGIGSTYARRNLRSTGPLVLAVGQVGWSVVMVAAMALLVDGRLVLPANPQAALAVGWLGSIGTGFAYIVFFRLLTGWGPTRASLVAYLLPVVAVVLGVVVLGESIDAFFLAGAALIVAGVWIVNRHG